MASGNWRWGRTAVRAKLLLAVTALGFVITALLVGILGQTARNTTEGVRGYLSNLDASDVVLQIGTGTAPDPAQQHQAFTAAVGRVFGSVPLDIERRLTSPAYTWEPSSGGDPGAETAAPVTVRLASYDDAQTHATAREGTWPRPVAAGSPTEVAVAADVAAEHRWQLGQHISVKTVSGTERPLTIVALFDKDTSPVWFAEQTLVPGNQIADRSPALQVDASVFDDITTSYVTWSLSPRADQLTADQVRPLSAALANIRTEINGDRAIDVDGILSTGGLVRSMATVQASLAAATLASPLPILLIVAFGVMMMLLLGRLMAYDRQSETALLKSRGVSARRLACWAAAETAVFALPGAGFGLLAAFLVTGVTAAGLWIAGASVVVAMVAVAEPAWRAGRAKPLREQLEDSGRGSSAMAATALVALLAVAAFSVWRFLRGTRLAQVAQDEQPVDPAALVAPPFALVAAAAVGLVLCGVITVGLQRITARMSSGLTLALPARQAARRRSVFGALVMLLALAAGSTVFAASYAGTAPAFHRQVAAAASGSDVRVVLPERDLRGSSSYSDPIAPYRAVPGVTAAAGVQRMNATAGDLQVALVGIKPSLLGAVIQTSAQFDTAAVAQLLTPAESEVGVGAEAGTDSGDGPLVLPEGTTDLEVTVRATAVSFESGDRLLATVWLLTPDGVLVPAAVRSDPEPDTQDAVLRGSVSGVQAGTAVLAIDLQTFGLATQGSSTLGLRSFAARVADRTADLPIGLWRYQSVGTANAPLKAVDNAPQVVVDASGPVSTLPSAIRFFPPRTASAIPAVLDSATVEQLGLQVGEEFDLNYNQVAVPMVVAGQVESLPGYPGQNAVLTDSAALDDYLLAQSTVLPALTEIWLASGDSDAVGPQVARAAGPAALVSSVNGGAITLLAQSAISGLWWGAVGALLLAAITVLLAIALLSRSRRSEVVVLRALGVTSGQQAAMRRRELVTTVVLAWLVGVVAGLAVAWLLVPGLAMRGAVGDATLRPEFGLSWSSAALLLAAHVVIVTVVTIGYGWWVRLRSGQADPREVSA